MSYSRAYAQERCKARTSEAQALLGGRCIQCGSSERLEFDHVDRSTKVDTVSKLVMASRAKWLAEVMKCQLLCRACHERKSILELGKKVAKGTHGTISSHRYCRCELCLEAMRVYRRQLLARRKSAAIA